MTAIYQSPFLLALGWAIAASLWQSGILWLLYQLVVYSVKKASPALKHNLSLVLVMLAFAWFNITLADKYNYISQQQTIQTAIAATAGNAGDVMSENNNLLLVPMYVMEWFNQFLPYISAAYLLILVLLAVRLLNAYAYAQKIKTRGLVPLDLHWLQLTEKYMRWLDVKKEVRIYLSEYIDVPATLNFFKPVILLPIAAFNNLSPQQVESVILHELSHIKRNDYLINMVVSVIETLLFFNPFIYMMGKALRKEREHCCDDFVLHFRFDPHSYASALLYLEKLRMGVTPVTAIAATGNNYQLLGRVKRIMNVNNNSFNYGQKLFALLITACILVSIAWLAPERSSAKKEKEAGVQPVAEVLARAATSAAPTPQKQVKKTSRLKTAGETIAQWQPHLTDENPFATPEMDTNEEMEEPVAQDDAMQQPLNRAYAVPTLPEGIPAPAAPLPPLPPAATIDVEYVHADALNILEDWKNNSKAYNIEMLNRALRAQQQQMAREMKKQDAQKKAAIQLNNNIADKYRKIQLEYERTNEDVKKTLNGELLKKTKQVAEQNQDVFRQWNFIFDALQDELKLRDKKNQADSLLKKKKLQLKRSIWVKADTKEAQPSAAAKTRTHFSLDLHIEPGEEKNGENNNQNFALRLASTVYGDKTVIAKGLTSAKTNQAARVLTQTIYRGDNIAVTSCEEPSKGASTVTISLKN